MGGHCKGIDASRVEEVEPLMQSVYHRNTVSELPGPCDPETCPLFRFSISSLKQMTFSTNDSFPCLYDHTKYFVTPLYYSTY